MTGPASGGAAPSASAAAAGTPAPWTIRFGLLTDPGRARERNEDACAVFVPFGGEASTARGDALFLVADGMGGHEAGDLASRHVAAVVRKWFTRRREPPDPADGNFDDALRAVLLEANQDLLALAEDHALTRGAGSTATVACLRGTTLHLAHVGDTRLYRLRNGTLDILTRDHSWVGEQQRAGLLSEEEAQHHPRRNMLTECLGVGPDVQIDLAQFPARVGDRYLLCSDGLHGPVPKEAIHDALASGHDPQKTARSLVAQANQRQGPDNITAVVIHLGPPLRDTLDQGLDGTLGGTLGITLGTTAPHKRRRRDPRTAETSTRRATRLLLATAGLLLLGSAALAGMRGTPPEVRPIPAPGDRTELPVEAPVEAPVEPPVEFPDDPRSGAAARTPVDTGDTLPGPGVVGPPDPADTLASPSPLPGGPHP